MLRLEDFKSGHGCTELQRSYIQDYAAIKAVANHRVRRKMLIIAVAPKPENVRRVSEPRHFECLEKFDPRRLIVPYGDVDIYLMFDRPVQSDRPMHRVETLVLGETGYLDSDGVPSVGGDRFHNHSEYDFNSKPFHACQGGEIRVCTDGPIKAKTRGRFRVRRTGRSLDLCVGNLPDKSPMINYRFQTSQVESGLVKIEGMSELPEDGETVDIGNVVEGDLLARSNKVVEYLQAGFQGSRPIIITRARKLIPAHREREFELFIRMNRTLLEHSPKTSGESRGFLVDPTKWAFPALFQFSSLDSLIHSKEFQVTQRLQEDVLAAVSPSGLDNWPNKRWFLHVRAAKSGTIQAINTENVESLGHVELVYEDGTIQIVPEYPALNTSLLYTYCQDGTRQTLSVGDVVRQNQIIGDYVPRLPYLHWDDLLAAAGNNALFLLKEFLASRSVAPATYGWEGPGVLLDYRYCYPFVEQLGERDGHGKLKWFWDLRAGLKYLDKARGYIIYPPMRYPDWNSSTMSMAGVNYFLGTHSEKNRTEKAEKQRSKVKETC